MFPVEGSNTKFIAGLGRKLLFVEWDGQSGDVSLGELIGEVDQEALSINNKFYGGKIDAFGRLWAGISYSQSLLLIILIPT